MTYTVRAYRQEDAATLAALVHEAVREGAARAYDPAQRAAWSPAPKEPEVLHARLAPQAVFVAEDDAGVCGFMTLAGDGHLDMAFVRPRVQGRGAAAALYDAVLDHARAAGMNRLYTEASLLFTPFLSRRGWTITEPETVQIGAVSLDRNCMAFTLEAITEPPRTKARSSRN